MPTARSFLQFVPILVLFASVVGFGIRLDTRQAAILRALPEGARYRMERLEMDAARANKRLDGIEDKIDKLLAKP